MTLRKGSYIIMMRMKMREQIIQEAKMINQEQGSLKSDPNNLMIMTPKGQVLEAVSSWAKIEMVEGRAQMPEPNFPPEREVPEEEAEK